MTNVASLSDNGPLGNVVSGFWSSKKLTEAHPFDDPYDAVNKLPENWSRLFQIRNSFIQVILTANGWENLAFNWTFDTHREFN